jgi:hypothetical protein
MSYSSTSVVDSLIQITTREDVKMKKAKEQLTGIAKALSSLSKQVDRLSKQVANPVPAKATKAKAGRKPIKAAADKTKSQKKDTVLDAVFDSIKRSRGGVTIPSLRSKTGLGARQLSNALYKLTKKKLIQAKTRGVYVKL